MSTPYYIVVEEQEYKDYCSVIDPKKVLILPKKYFKEYDNNDVFDDRLKRKKEYIKKNKE